MLPSAVGIFALGIGMEILLLLFLLQKIAMESLTRRGTPKKLVYLPQRAISQKNEVRYRIILRAL